MARLIVKSPYIKCGTGQSAGGYLKYIATRERVEIIPDDRPPTNKQEQFIAKLVKDFPDAKELMEYADYLSHSTKATASALITLALESNWDRVQGMEGYAKYIALRPRVERLGEHGLFGDDDSDVHDPAKGIYWLKRSADNGNDFAAYRLGKEYLSGKNVSKDTSTAAEYLRQAADNGNAYAQYLLGKLTLMGEGIPKDMDAAYEWFAAARDNGHAYAEFFMKRMERGEQEPPSVLLSATRLLYHMGNIFRDNAPAPAATGVQIDRKRLAQMRQKRVALGHKPDDHELEQQQGFSMKFHM